MILLPCPWCGPRDASEFGHVGELVKRPDPASATREQWRSYLYLRANARGWVVETWYHRMGCRQFIKVERHTDTNETRELSANDSAANDSAANDSAANDSAANDSAANDRAGVA